MPTTILSENFDGYANATPITSVISNPPGLPWGAPAGTITVSNTQSVSAPNSARWAANSSRAYIRLNYTPTQKITCIFNMRGVGAYNKYVYTAYEAAAAYDATKVIAGIFFTSTFGISARSNGAWAATGRSWTQSQWYEVKFILDYTAGTYELWIDGEYINTYIITGPAYIATFEGYTQISNTSNPLWVDNPVITEEDAPPAGKSLLLCKGGP